MTSLHELYKGDFEQVDRVVSASIDVGDAPLIRDLAGYVVAPRGKRIRPLLALMSARICGYQGDKHIQLAAALELMHTATLLHDDVVDESLKRRGQDCAHTLWGNKAAVLVGDFLFSRSFQLIVGSSEDEVLRAFSQAATTIAQGEVSQLAFSFNSQMPLERYMEIISAKTGSLLSVACEIGALLTKQPQEIVDDFRKLGLALGSIFQITDDLLDYEAPPEVWGKNLGDDFLEGKVTLPFILAHLNADEMGKKRLVESIQRKTSEDLQTVVRILHATNSFHEARRHVSSFAERAACLIGRLSERFHQTDQFQTLMELCMHRVQ